MSKINACVPARASAVVVGGTFNCSKPPPARKPGPGVGLPQAVDEGVTSGGEGEVGIGGGAGVPAAAVVPGDEALDGEGVQGLPNGAATGVHEADEGGDRERAGTEGVEDLQGVRA